MVKFLSILQTYCRFSLLISFQTQSTYLNNNAPMDEEMADNYSNFRTEESITHQFKQKKQMQKTVTFKDP